MKRHKQWMFGGYVIISIICFTACGIKKQDSSSDVVNKVITESDSGNIKESKSEDSQKNQNSSQLSMDITNNMVIDADIENENISQSIIYQTSYKEFDVNKVKQLFFTENNELNITQNGENTIIESKDGALLMIGDGGITYTISDNMSDLEGFIKQAYSSELDYGISHENELEELEQETIVQNVEKILKDICELGDGEELLLKAGVNIDTDSVLKIQEQQKQELQNKDAYQRQVEYGLFNELDKDWEANECYFLSFSIKKNNIPLINSNEPSIKTRSENIFIEKTNLEVIVNQNGIQLLYVTGIFDLKEISETDIISAQDIALLLKQKYDIEIITDDCIVNKIWLEYLFVSDPSTQEFAQGTLEPYWCFQIKETGEDEDGEYTSYIAERFNAVTGDDFEYE